MKLTLTVLVAAVNLSVIASQNTRPTVAARCTGYKSRVDQACTSGYQGDCSARCAQRFLPYYRECADSERELAGRNAFNQKCTEAVNVDRPADSRGDRGAPAALYKSHKSRPQHHLE